MKNKIKVKIVIVAEISSDEYDSPETIIDELSQECEYDIPSTENVTVHGTEFRDCQLI